MSDEHVKPVNPVVEALTRQIVEDMVPMYIKTCEEHPDKIVEKLLSEATVEPILIKIKENQGSQVRFKPLPSMFTPIKYAEVKAKQVFVKNVSTERYVNFLKDDAKFVDFLEHVLCSLRESPQIQTDALTHKIKTLLEPYSDYITEVFELKGKSAGGHKHRGHKQKSRRGHKQKTRRGHKTRRHKRRSTRKH
jgi:hypothetical protein